MFTEARSRLGWRTGASRVAMKDQLKQLQSFDPVERAQAGEQLVELGLNRCAEPLLDHVANEFDNRVLATIAHGVLQAPANPKESRKAQELRDWAAGELERSAIEASFMGEGDGASPLEEYRFDVPPKAPEPLPVRVPASVAAGEPDHTECRFELPAESDTVEWEAPPEPEPTEYRFESPPAAPEAFAVLPQPQHEATYESEPEPQVAYAPEPQPEVAYAPEPEVAYEPEPELAVDAQALPYISWRPPADGEPVTLDDGYGPNGLRHKVHDDMSWPGTTPLLDEPADAEELEPVGEEPEPVGYRFAGPPPIDSEPSVDPEPDGEAAPRFATPPRFEPEQAVEAEQVFEPEPVFEPEQEEEAAVEALPSDPPAPAPVEEYRFEPPGSDGPASPPPASDEPPAPPTPPRTLAERLRARNA